MKTLLGGVIWLALGWPGLAQEPLTVSAAMSLANVLEEIGEVWTRATGTPVRFNFAPSNALARQVVNGAPVDVFISADEAQMDVAERVGALIAGSRVPVVRNQLAVAALPARAAFVKENFFRAPPEIRRLALGHPEAVPAGVYAKQYLEKRGLWQAYAARVVPTANVRAALAAVDNGSADAAIVYVSDLATARDAVASFAVPIEDGPSILYPGAVVGSSRQRAAAERFLAFLRAADAQAMFARHGFLPLAGR